MANTKVTFEQLKKSLGIKPTDFVDYRQFLSAIFTKLKKQLGSYSYLSFSEDLGLGRCNASRLIIVGERPLTVKTAHKIADALELKGSQRNYFISMVETSRTQSKKRVKAIDQLVAAKSKSVSSDLSRNQLAFFSEWHHTAIFELIQQPGAKADFEWISSKLIPKVSAKKVSESLYLLQDLGYIWFDVSEQKFIVKEQHIHTEKEVSGLAFNLFHTKFIQLAKDSINGVDFDQRHITSITVGTSPEGKKRITELIEKTLDEVLEIAESCKDEANEVTQVNIQAFPVAKHDKKGSGT